MKTSTQIAATISQEIAHIFIRPSMHIGQTDSFYSAYALDAILSHMHYLWADLHERADEFGDIHRSKCKSEGCDCLGLADGFYRIKKNVDHALASRFVLGAWRDISQTMGIPLDDGEGRNALDVDF